MAKKDKVVEEIEGEVSLGTSVATTSANRGGQQLIQGTFEGGYDAADIGAGFEGTTSEDYLIPFLAIYQKMHPQVDPDSPAFVEGAKPGQIFNSVTAEAYDGKEGIIFIPIHREHSFIEWVPRNQGGGFVGKHDPASPLVQEAKANATEFADYHTPDDNDLSETFSVYGLQVLPDGATRPAIISFASTQIKQYKKWMTRAQSIQLKNEVGDRFPAPLFAHTYRLRSRLQENAEGTWHGWDIGFSGENAEVSRLAPENVLYLKAKELRAMILSGQAKADMSSVRNVDTSGEGPEASEF